MVPLRCRRKLLCPFSNWMKINHNDTYGVYVHIPFCLQKCAYCDFVSYPGLLSRAASYLEALRAEAEHYRGLRADTIYIGGGTPTCLAVEDLTGLLEDLQQCFCVTDDCEITVECNPKTADGAYFNQLRKVGVNRLSVGVQSFCEDELRLLGRLHSAEEARECIKLAQDAGFQNISLDLMFGLPYQTKERLAENVKEALQLEPTHISAYSLILEEGTPLAERVQNGELQLPEEETEREMYHFLTEKLAQEGYLPYEISNFARCGFESRHNNKYWERKPYIGLGAAAHSQVEHLRFGNPVGLEEYIRLAHQEAPIGRETEILSKADEMAEFVFLGLRKRCGIRKTKFSEQFSENIETVYGKQLANCYQWGLLTEDGDTIRLTKRGIDVSNRVFCEFLPEEES